MERVSLTPSVELSRLVYGMWRLGDDADTSPKHVRAKIDALLAQGITSIDQADIYGDYCSEIIFGGALKEDPSLRDQLEIITKCDIMLLSQKFPDRRVKYYDTSAAHIEMSVDASLRNMGVDVLDLLLIHRPDPLMDHRETGAALDGLIQRGKVKAVGVSNFKLHDWTLLQSAMTAPLATNQIEASLVEHRPFTNGDIAYLQERGVPPMAWSPLAGGALFAADRAPLSAGLTRIADAQGVDEAAVAIAWLLAHPSRILPVLGTNDLDRIKRISAALRVEIDRETWFELYTLALGHEVP